MVEYDTGTSRRTFIKASGATGAAGLFAGCLGGDEGGVQEQVEDPSELPEEEITWHHLGAPDQTLHNHRQALTFKQFMEYHTDGRFTVNIAPAGQLAGDVESVEQAQQGAIEIVGGIAEGHIAPFLPDMNVIAMPYAYPDIDVANFVWDHTDFGRDFRAHMYEQMDVLPLGWYDNGGFRHYSANVPLRGPEDLEGLTIRNMDIEGHLAITRALGATPQPIDWTELYEALDTGVVDGQENSIPTVALGNLQEVQDYIMKDGHVFSINFALASGSWFENLHPTYQGLVREAGLLGTAHSRMVNRLQRVQLETVYEEEYGIEIYEPTAAQMQEFRDLTVEPVGEIIETQMDDVSWIARQEAAVEEAVEAVGYNPL
jgi:C4-dicarboxylate-binding protein DctP